MTAQPSLTNRAVDFFQGLISRARGVRTVDIPRIDDYVFARYANYYQERTSILADGLADGTIDVDEWLIAMEQEVNNLHATAYAVGVGGFNQLDSQDVDEINRIVDGQVQYLNRWADQLRSQTEIDPRALKTRANLYMGAANSTIQTATTQAMGMPNLPAYSGDGSSTCLTKCLCGWDIQQLSGDGNWNAFWRVDASAEHCAECMARGVEWNPLKIRGGEIQPYDSAGLFA